MTGVDPSNNVINIPGYGPMTYADWLQMVGAGNYSPTPTPTSTPAPVNLAMPSGVLGPMPPPHIPQYGFGTPTPTPTPAGTPAPPFTEPGDLGNPDYGPGSTSASGSDTTGGEVSADELGNVPGEAFPPGSKIPASAYNPPASEGWGTRSDDSGKVAGVDLSPTDRANIALHNLGLPPLPAGYNPLGGLPSGFIETNRFGMGAPTFTSNLTEGPTFSGGSIFGGLPLPTGAAGGTASPGAVSVGMGPLPGSFAGLGAGGYGNLSGWGGALTHGIWGGRHPWPMQTWLANAAFRNYQGNPFGTGQKAGGIGGSYQNYLNIWNSLRSAPPTMAKAGERTGIGIGGGGRPATAGYQFGGVAGDNDFYSSIGQKTYDVGRKVENKANDVFHALGELGKYLKGSEPRIPLIEGTLPGLPKDNLLHGNFMQWLTDPADTPARMRGTRLAGLGGVYDPSFPPWAPRRGPWPLKQEPPDTGRFLPQLYEQRASGTQLAANTDKVPAMLTPGEVVLNDEQQSAVMPVPGREHMLLPNQRARLAKQMWS